MTALRAVSAGLGVALVAYIARMRGVEALGEFALLFAAFVLTQQLPLLGLHVPIAREAAAAPERLAAIMSNSLAIALPAGGALALAVGVGGVLAFPGRADLQGAFWLVGLALLPAALTGVADAALVGRDRAHVLARVLVGENVARTLAAMGALALGYGLEAVFALFLAARVGAAAVYLRAGNAGALFAGGRVEARAVLELARRAPVYLGIVLLALLVTRVDLIVLTHAASMEEAGRYAAPYRIYEAGMMIPSMATFVLFPALVRMFAAAPAQFPLMVQLVMRSGLVLATPVVLVLCFAASDIMRVVFGAAYVTAHGVLQVLAVNLLLLWLHQTLANALMAAGRQKLDLIANAFACALYLPLLYFLAGARGAIGAALAMTLMWAVQVALRLWFLRDAPSQASTLGGLGKVALAGAAAALVSFGLAPRLGYGALALGLVAYALAIFWCRAFTRADAHGVGQALAMRVAS